MCKTKMAVSASQPATSRRTSSRPRSTRSPAATDSSIRPSNTGSRAATISSSSSSSATASYPSTSAGGGTSSFTPATSSVSSGTSLSSIRESISQNPLIYDVSEIRAATNNFLAKPYSSSTSSSSPTSASSAKCWRCTLRGADTIVFQRKFRQKLPNEEVKRRLSVIARSHHVSLVKILGAAVSGEHIYLVYEFVPGANLSDCLRNRINRNFTVLSSWTSRIQIAADVAHALDYIHHKTGLNLTLVHNYIKSSGIIVTEPALNARICHFGAAYLCGDILEPEADERGKQDERQTTGEVSFEGVRGYMAPEFQRTGVPTQESDVYAFGVVILELVSGEEPLKYRFDRERGDFVRTSVIETAREAVEHGEGRLRQWVDRKLRDSFPVDVAEKLVRLALECVHVEPGQRPGMGRVAGKVSKLFLKSQAWSESIRVPHDQISVSLAPR